MGTRVKRLCRADRHPNVLQSQAQGANLTLLSASSSPYLFLNTSHVQRGVCTDKSVQGPYQIRPLLLSGEADSDRTGDSIQHPRLTLMPQSLLHVPPFGPCDTPALRHDTASEAPRTLWSQRVPGL